MGVELSRRALRDLRRLSQEDRAQASAGLDRLERNDPNLSAHPLTGHPGWLELRVGELRVLYLHRDAPDGWWVERIVHRQALFTAVRTL